MSVLRAVWKRGGGERGGRVGFDAARKRRTRSPSASFLALSLSLSLLSPHQPVRRPAQPRQQLPVDVRHLRARRARADRGAQGADVLVLGDDVGGGGGGLDDGDVQVLRKGGERGGGGRGRSAEGVAPRRSTRVKTVRESSAPPTALPLFPTRRRQPTRPHWQRGREARGERREKRGPRTPSARWTMAPPPPRPLPPSASPASPPASGWPWPACTCRPLPPAPGGRPAWPRRARRATCLGGGGGRAPSRCALLLGRAGERGTHGSARAVVPASPKQNGGGGCA